ncbi:hypothetical protein V6N13_124144 [Hibiscus sabdariffa]
MGFSRRPFRIAELADKFREQDDNEEIVELKESSAVKSASPVSRETFVPDSIQSHALKSMEMERMCEGNKKVDLRVRDTAGWMAEEDIGIIERGEEQRCNAMDLSVECDFSEERQAIPDDKSVATSPINRGPQGRAKLADVIEYGGQQRKVRQISKIVMTDSSLVRVETNKLVSKRGRGRPKTKGTDATHIVNGSLSDSDFLHRKRVILREAEETVQLGKLIGATPKGNEKLVIQDIARIIEARELQQ